MTRALRPARLAIALLVVACCFSAQATDDRPAHYSGEPADTTRQALAHLDDYNARLQALLAKEEVDLHAVHELTYTLENALQRIQADLADAAAALEEVHLASEAADSAQVKARGRAYLEATRPLVE